VPVWRFAFSARETVPPAVKEGGGELEFGESRKFRTACVEPNSTAEPKLRPTSCLKCRKSSGRAGRPPLQFRC